MGLLIPLAARLSLPKQADALNMLHTMLANQTPVSAKFLAELLTTFGAYTLDDEGVSTVDLYSCSLRLQRRFLRARSCG